MASFDHYEHLISVYLMLSCDLAVGIIFSIVSEIYPLRFIPEIYP